MQRWEERAHHLLVDLSSVNVCVSSDSYIGCGHATPCPATLQHPFLPAKQTGAVVREREVPTELVHRGDVVKVRFFFPPASACGPKSHLQRAMPAMRMG